MSEIDVFETRFAATYRRYLDEAPTEVDAAAVVRTIVAAHPRARRWPWALRPARALAWLVLLALLLAALGAAALFVGSHRPALGFACPAGSTPDKPGPVDQARPPQDAPTVMAFDRRAGRLVALVGVDDSVETWTFDVCTNTWTQMHPSREPFGWVRLVYDVDSDLTIGVASCRNCDLVATGIVWAYDPEANTWTERGAAPSGATPLFYDPVSGLVVALGDDGDPDTLGLELWSYDVKTGTWTPIRQAKGPDGGVFAYDASVDRIIAYGDGTWLFDIRTGRWSRSGVVTPGVWGSGIWGAPPAIAYDEAAERTVVFGSGLAAYDATADRWEVLIDDADRGPSDWLPSSIVYDPVNRRLVGLGRGVIVDQGGVVACDLVTREWTVLLEPGNGLPATSAK